MKNWQKALIITLITLTIGGIYLLVVFEQRRNPGVANQTNPEQNLTPDDVAVVRMMFPTSFDDVLKLQNTSVWMKNGYTMPYFPYKSGHIDFIQNQGKIPSAQRLDIKKVIKAAAPAQVDDGISHGSRQVFAVFMLPGGTSLYATAIGVIERRPVVNPSSGIASIHAIIATAMPQTLCRAQIPQRPATRILRPTNCGRGRVSHAKAVLCADFLRPGSALGSQPRV